MWLESLKVGDAVIVNGRMWNYGKHLTTIERTTPTQIIVQSGRYRKSDGYGIGDTGGSLNEATPSEIDHIERKQLAEHIITALSERSRLDGTPVIASLPKETLENILRMTQPTFA